MERNQFWIFIGLGLAIGVCLEIMKSPSASPVRLAGFSKFETLLDEGRPVYGADSALDLQEKRPVAAVEKIPVQPVAKNEEPVAVQIAANETQAPASGNGDAAASPIAKDGEQKPKTEEEKKKEEAKKKEEEKKKKKKKKKKKADEQAQELAQGPTDTSDDDDKKASDDSGANDTAMAPLSGGVFPQATDSVNGLPKTIAEWEAYLMKDADFERTSTFIKLYQTAQVKPDVFYPVVEAMMDDKRPKIREMAVMALGATTSSRSFELLADVLHHESESRLKTQAELYMKMYSRLENLKHLANVVGSQDTRSQYEAIRMIKRSAEQYLKTARPATTAGRPATTAITRVYSPFLTVLQQASVQSSDVTVRRAALETSQVLQSMLNTVASQQPAQTQPPATT